MITVLSNDVAMRTLANDIVATQHIRMLNCLQGLDLKVKHLATGMVLDALHVDRLDSHWLL